MKGLEKSVLVEKSGHVATLIVNRPQKLNCFNKAVVDELTACLKQLEYDEDTKLIFIEGSGERAFCAGGDLVEMKEVYKRDGKRKAMQLFQKEYALNYYVSDYKKPIITYLDGITMGSGVGFSIGTDFRIVNENTAWAMPEVKIGFFPDVGAGYYLSKMVDGLGKYLALTGKIIKAEDCVFLEVADYKISSRDYTALKQDILEFSWEKLNLNEVSATIEDMIQDYSVEIEEGYLQKHRKDIQLHFDKQNLDEIWESLQKDTDSPFVKDALQEMNENLPIAMAVTIEQLNRAKHMYLKECFEQDLILSENFLNQGDVFEGIYAKLEQKRKTDIWQAKSFERIEKNRVETYFL